MPKKCFICKQQFPENNIVEYGGRKYCANCLEEKIMREKFSKTVCGIFGLKKPGSRIWGDRKKLLDNGFTDEEIIKCLDYCYNVVGYSKVSESLYCVNVSTLGAANAYFKEKMVREKIATQERIINPVQPKQFIKRQEVEIQNDLLDLDDILNED